MTESGSLSINLLGCIKEDGRTSLDHYANKLSKRFLELGLQHNLFNPSSMDGDLGIAGKLGLRTARYFGYPQFVNGLPFSRISHVIDDGYAHLFSRIRSKHKVITLTDLMPLLGWQKKIEGLCYPRPPMLYKYSLSYLDRYDKIITFSESNKRQLIEFKICQPSKIKVVPLGVDEEFFKMADIPKQQARKIMGLEENAKIVLITGALQYKNLGNSLEAILRCKERMHENIIALRLGPQTDHSTYLEAQYKNRLLIKSFKDLTREQVGLVYRGADMLLFPSWHEGFGMPLVEAMACGIPTIISDRASLPEISAGTSLIVKPNNVEKMSFHIQQIFEKAILFDKRIETGKIVADKYLWSKIGDQTASVYDEIGR